MKKSDDLSPERAVREFTRIHHWVLRREFLKVRREMLAKRVSKFLNSRTKP